MTLFPEHLPNVDLLIAALRKEGRSPEVISRATWLALTAEQRGWEDYLVLADETFEAWASATA